MVLSNIIVRDVNVVRSEYKGFCYELTTIPYRHYSELVIPHLKINRIYPVGLSFDELTDLVYQLVNENI